MDAQYLKVAAMQAEIEALKIEADALKTEAKEQPLARDIMFVSSKIRKISNELHAMAEIAGIK